jgi:tellurite resistance protein TerC
MNKTQVIYIVFGALIMLSLFIDFGLFSKKNTLISPQKALLQILFWVATAFGFFIFMWIEEGDHYALAFLSAYLMEWSLSVDNIFVFIIIFSAFNINEKYYGRVLLIGILTAILLRIIFITLGIALVREFEWLFYVFGLFLIYSGYKIFSATEDEEFKPKESRIYKLIKKVLPLVNHDGNGKYHIKENGKIYFTNLFLVILLLGAVDLVFAIDSIPAVFGISRDKQVIYTSNIFAVLGLRSLFFLLRHAVSKFDYLQQGIAIVLIFIGVKMVFERWLLEFINKELQVVLSFIVIILCLSGSIIYSIKYQKKGVPKDIKI